eukprot:SAG22_NODE_1763_length_3628_cov_1.648243_1_plen_135_part_00
MGNTVRKARRMELQREALEAIAADEAKYYPNWKDAPSWMETSDDCGEFRELAFFPQFRLAVAKRTKIDFDSYGGLNAECPSPAGYRIAKAADLIAAGLRVGGYVAPKVIRRGIVDEICRTDAPRQWLTGAYCKF